MCVGCVCVCVCVRVILCVAVRVVLYVAVRVLYYQHDTISVTQSLTFPIPLFLSRAADTAFNRSEGFSSFLGKFSVPHAPPRTPHILYVFTGLQKLDW